jgi:hypothetical protein
MAEENNYGDQVIDYCPINGKRNLCTRDYCFEHKKECEEEYEKSRLVREVKKC